MYIPSSRARRWGQGQVDRDQEPSKPFDGAHVPGLRVPVAWGLRGRCHLLPVSGAVSEYFVLTHVGGVPPKLDRAKGAKPRLPAMSRTSRR